MIAVSVTAPRFISSAAAGVEKPAFKWQKLAFKWPTCAQTRVQMAANSR